jgi:hypothetical protein
MNQLEIAVRGTSLTPDLIRRGLNKNLDLLSEEQALALNDVVVPHHAATRGRLHSIVQQDGAESLRDVEQVLWALEDIPQANRLAHFALIRRTLPESISSACEPVHALEDLMQELVSSRALKTLLQACLVSTNVLSQKGNPCLRIDMLPGLSFRRLQANAPSILTLVARSLQRQHDARCRLRFLRMMAVGATPVAEAARKCIWLYLDDLQESPWNVLETLERCKKRNLVDYMTNLQQEELPLRQSVDLVQNSRENFNLTYLTSQSCIPEQLASLSVSLQEAVGNVQACKISLPRIAQEVSEFFGADRGQMSAGHKLDYATEVMQNLYCLGQRLEQEKQSIDRKRRYERSWRQGGETCQKWTAVNTECIVMHRTNDPDLIRAGKGDHASVHRPESKQKIAQLLHGGPDGEYRRCELTGTWVPVGFAAAVAERDRGSRGANAGFFVTY